MDDAGFGATTADVEALIRNDFSPDQHGRVWEHLQKVETAVPEHSVRRVQVAALTLARGDWSALEHYVNQAAVDYRDVLAPAFYPNQ